MIAVVRVLAERGLITPADIEAMRARALEAADAITAKTSTPEQVFGDRLATEVLDLLALLLPPDPPA